MSKLYRVVSKEYVTKILSEQKITVDFVDVNSVQNLVEFVEFANPTIQYKADDFLFSLTKEKEASFKKNLNIDLSQVEQFGWYYSKIHKSEIQLYRATSPKKFQTLTDINPEIKIDSFDKYRDFYRPIKATNILNGAFGLSYIVFKDEYNNFFRKIKVHKDKWVFDKSKLDKSDYPILTHLFLFFNAETKGLNKTLLKDEELKGVRIFSYYLETALNYFLRNDYSMDNFLSKMKGEFEQYPELKVFADDFKLLNDRYVKKGLSVDTKNPIIIATKEFIDLAKTESENLNELLTQNDLNKTAVFLLGMLNLGDRIDEQFSFDNFVPAIVDLTMRHVVDIKVSEKEVVISFDQKEIEKNRNNKFDYVQDYFKELHTLKEFSDELNDLTKKSNLFKKIYESQTEIIELDADAKDLEKTIERYGLQKKNLIDQAKDSKWFDKKYEEWINSENEKESLEKITKRLSDEISGLKDDKKDYEKDESDLSKEIYSLKAKIKTLKQTKKSLNLEKDELEKKEKPPKKTEAKKTSEESSEKDSASKNKSDQKPKGKSEKIEGGQTSLLTEDKSPTPTPPDG
jgi:hypothetical protein|tara:strand:+ start:2616 stop:4328 length:1713 start_codon:yes stop_codon:yes gene_type:complete